MANKKTFREKEETVAQWHDIHMSYWHKNLGDLYDIKEHWDDAFHSPSVDDWWDLFDVADVLKRQYPDEWHRQPRLSTDLDELEHRLKMSKPVIKPGVKLYNKQMFRFWMAFKDFLNDIAGTPTKQYTIKERQSRKEQENPSNFQRLFNIGDQDETAS